MALNVWLLAQDNIQMCSQGKGMFPITLSIPFKSYSLLRQWQCYGLWFHIRVLQALPEIRSMTLASLSPALMNWGNQMQTWMSSFGSLWSWLALKCDTCFTSLSGLQNLSIWGLFCISFKSECFLKWTYRHLWKDYFLLAKDSIPIVFTCND